MIGTSTGASACRSRRYSVVANIANADTGGWGCCNSSHHEPKTPNAKVKPETECVFRPITGAKEDHVWTPFYPLLDD